MTTKRKSKSDDAVPEALRPSTFASRKARRNASTQPATRRRFNVLRTEPFVVAADDLRTHYGEPFAIETLEE